MRRGRFQPLAIVAVFIAIAAFQLINRHSAKPVGERTSAGSSATAASSAQPARDGGPKSATTPEPVIAGNPRLDAISNPDERAEVEKTLALIDRGGPFVHRQDGSVFSNREGQLPRKAQGYYREYTVETPGADTRGARRIVRGAEHDSYYTNDHYRTFVRVE